MAINGQTLTLKLSLTLPSLITQSRTALHTSRWISKLLKIEGAGQIDFCSYQLLLLTQSENVIGKHRPSPLHLWVSACNALFLMGSWWAAAAVFRDWSRGCQERHVRIINTDARPSAVFARSLKLGLCFPALSVKDLFDVYLRLLIPLHHIATSYRWPFVLHHWLPPSHFLHLRLLRHWGRGSQEAVTIFTQTQSHRCQLGDWFSFPSSLFSFPLFFWPYPLFILSISLSGTDLWDQPSKTDSEFFTDHECVSSYATEAEMERKKGWTSKYVTYLSVFFSHFSFNLGWLINSTHIPNLGLNYIIFGFVNIKCAKIKWILRL